ncbi:MAG: hypothetical protein QOF39_3354 [Frankiales bacterium]|nr:hypothetical protein [Frankiales bacterium]
MADRRITAAVLAVAASLLMAGCTGVPQAGAVHRTQAAQDVKGVADYPQQQAPGPAPKANQATIIGGLLQAMSAGDNEHAQQFMTNDLASQWSASATQQALVFSYQTVPTPITGSDETQWSVRFQQTAVIDSSSSYRWASGPVAVTFKLVRVAGQWRVSSIGQRGTFILAQSLAQILTPKTLYFPSRLVGPSGVPRLVPDTVFMPRKTDLTGLVQQLLQAGPTHWLAPAVSVTTPASAQVLSVVTDSSGLTTVNLQHLGTLSPAAIRTLEAQVAYTLNAAQPQPATSPIIILSNNQQLGPPFTLSQVADGYNPDALPPSAPFYFVRKDQLLIQTPAPQGAPNVAAGATLPADPPAPVLAHVDGVGQIAVSAVTAEQGGSASQAVAGVLTGNGTATLEVGAIPSTAALPWTAVPLPAAKALSTPSFDAVGRSVWTVATSPSGSTQVYRVPYGVGSAIGSPEPVRVTNALGKPLDDVTVVRLSRDGARAAVVANGQAYVGVVALTGSATGDVWTISEARPIITSASGTDDVDVFWADRSRVGVVVRDRQGQGKQDVMGTRLETVAADGYATADGGSGSSDALTGQVEVAGAPSGAVQFAGGPQLLWLVSYKGQLRRQPTPSSTDGLNPGLPWEVLGEGTWPTYAG